MSIILIFVYIVLIVAAFEFASYLVGLAKDFIKGFLKGVMAHKVYKATGLRVMDTKEGDFLLTDAGWKSGAQMTLTLSEPMLENIRTDDAAAAQLGRQLRAFLLRHRDLRHDRDS